MKSCRSGRQILARDQDNRLLGDERHGRKIVQRIVWRMLIKRLGVSMRASTAKQELMPVRRSFRHAGSPGRATGTGHVLNDDRLAQNF